jgi:hypothetical protein
VDETKPIVTLKGLDKERIFGRMPQSLAQVHIHVIFSTKNRMPFLVGAEFRKEMHAYLASNMNA